MRFVLVDQITSLEADKTITAVKNLTMAEEYLADHFPGFPVMPGVLMLESLVQTSAWLMRYTEDFQYSTILLKQTRALRFNNFVTPGKTLEVSSTLLKKNGNEWTFKAAGTVDGTSAVSAKLTIEQFNIGDNNDKLSSSDELRIKAMKDMFEQIWTPPSD